MTAAAVAGGGVGAQSRSTTQGVSPTEIKVAGIQSTPLSFTEATTGVGALARFARANKTGEIPGKRKIKIVAWADDKVDPATTVQEVRRLVQQEGVFALVPVASTVINDSIPNQSHTPVFGYGMSAAFCSSGDTSYFFGFNGCVTPKDASHTGDNVVEMKAAVYKEGIVRSGQRIKIAIIGTDSAQEKDVVAQFTAAAKANGMTIAYAKAATPAPPNPILDYTPWVQDMLATDPDLIVPVGPARDWTGLGKALNLTGFTGMYIVPGADPQLAKLIGPSYAWTTWAPNESADTNPEIKRMLDDIQAYAPGTNVNLTTSSGWLAADMFVKALQKTGEKLTSEKLQDVASHMTYERKGLIGPTTYPTNYRYTSPSCHAVLKTDGESGSYSVVEPFSCSPKRYAVKPYDEIETP
ncbi:MAG TPA: ABC transporter substrate-binding protein [Acidimicrobiia bacterium]